MASVSTDVGTSLQGFALSPQQRRVWAASDPAMRSRRVQATFLCEGALDVDRFQQALDFVVERHEVLRTVFRTAPGMRFPLQIIEPPDTKCLLSRHLVCDVTEGEPQDIDLVMPTLAGEGAPVTCALIALSPGRHALVVDLDAMCVDVASLRILISEIAAAYAGAPRSGETMQYADLSEWQNRMAESEEAEVGRRYWERFDACALERLRLPWQSPNVSGDVDIRTRRERAGSPLTAALRQRAAHWKVELRDLLVTAWYAAIWRVTAASPVVVGVAFDGRNHAPLHHALGPLTRYLPIDVLVKPESRLSQLCVDVACLMREAEQWQHSFAWSDESLSADSTPSVLFEHRDECVARAGDVQLLLRRFSGSAEPFRVKLSSWIQDGELIWDFHHDRQWFREAAPDALLVCYRNLLEHAATEDPPITNLRLMDARERRWWVTGWNATAAAEPWRTVPAVFTAQAERTPEAVAMRSAAGTQRFGALEAEANRLGRYLQRCGVGPETRVGLYLERGAALALAMLATVKAGGAYVPLDPTYPAARLRWMAEDAALTVVVTDAAGHAQWPAGAATVVNLAAVEAVAAVAGEAPTPPVVALGPDHLAYVLYTSGSTGRPKGVMISHRALLNYVHWSIAAYRVADGEGAAVHTPVGFDLTVTSLWTPWLAGRAVTWVPEVPGGTAVIAALAHETTYSVLKLTPAHLEVVGGGSAPRARVGRVVVGGDALWAEALAGWRQVAPTTPIINEYGPTETTVGCCVHEVAPTQQTGPVPIGRPIANTELYVLDATGEPVPAGVAGELYIGGAGLARGYWRQPDQTAARFGPDPFSGRPGARLYRSGDWARHRADGALEYLGRLDGQIKLRGYRIEPGEIEAALVRQPEVAQAAVGRHAAQLVGYVVLHGTAPRDWAARVRRGLETTLPPWLVPAVLLDVPALPLTPHGKVDRAALPAPAAHLAAATREARPRTPTEDLLAGIWADLLDHPHVGLHDNFFALGGHSLTAIRLNSRIADTFRVDLPLQKVFETPTVAGLALALDSLTALDQRGPIPRVARDGPLPLSFVQQDLWLHAQLVSNQSTYNVPGAVRLEGPLDVATLECAVNDVVARHEILRTTFINDGDSVRQRIDADLTVPLPLGTVVNANETDRELAIQRQARELNELPFSLDRAPLMRLRLLRFSDEDHALLLSMHHTITDGWSFDIFADEVAALYDARVLGDAPALPELPIQYADYATWQRGWLTEDILAVHRGYWREQLRDLPAVRLGTADVPPNAPADGVVHDITLAAPMSAALRNLSRQEGVTLFMLMLAAFKVLLSHQTGQTDIVVGSDVANRNRPETERVMGFFVNQLVLRTRLDDNPTFRELLQRVRDVTLAACAHQDLPYGMLVRGLGASGGPEGGHLFDVAFALQPERRDLSLNRLRVTRQQVYSGAARLPLTLIVTDDGECLSARWRYDRTRIDVGTIASMAAGYERLLTCSESNPDARLGDLIMRLESDANDVRMASAQTADAGHAPPRRSSVDLSELALVESTTFGQAGLPLVIEPALPDVDLFGWARESTAFITDALARGGALLFRGFGLTSVSAFEEFAHILCGELFDEYGDLPREGIAGKIYSSTPYPPNQTIHFHNESSHLHQWPMKQCFFCVQPAPTGGETPILDCRATYRALDRTLTEEFARKGVMYVRNFVPGLDTSWQEFFRTTDPEVVTASCRAAGVDVEWRDAGHLRMRRLCPAVARHPRTGETVFFNQVQLHHPMCMDPAVKDALSTLFAEADLPRNVYFGDGSRIPDSAMQEIAGVYDQLSVAFPWQAGDVLLVDNMLVAHARRPFSGPRKIVVAMGDMMTLERLVAVRS